MGNTLTWVRMGATAVVAALSALTQTYPHDVWIPVALAAFASMGIHAIPAIGQTAPKGQETQT